MPEPLGRRRLVAILAADVVGYSRLMGADEQGTLVRLMALRAETIDPIIARHDGRLVKLMGDGALVELGSAVAAASCALEIQAALAERNATLPEGERLQLRIGLHLGDVLVVDDDIYGDGVNVAARLEQAAEPGGIAASKALVDQIRGRIPVVIRDGGERQLKNIDGPVQLFHLGPSPAGVAATSARTPVPRGLARRRSLIAVMIALLVLAAGALGAWLWIAGRAAPSTARGPEPTDRPAIAVLPFHDPSAAKDDSWFADGLAEDLASALSQFRELMVISYNASRAWRDPAADPATVGQALGARYLIRGSLRREAERLRVTAELVDARERTIRWSERLEVAQSGTFEVQDTIVRRVVTVLALRIGQLERNRVLAKPASDLAAYDLVLRGRHRLAETKRAANREARRLIEQAIELDPLYAPAQVALAQAWYQTVTAGWTEFPEEAIGRMERSAARALELDSTLPSAHRLMALVHLQRRQYALGADELDRALELNPSDAESLSFRGAMAAWDGRADAAIEDLLVARKIDPTLEPVDMNLAMAYYLVDRPLDAIAVAEAGLRTERNSVFRSFLLATRAAAAASLGRGAEAEQAREELTKVAPFFDVDAFVGQFQLERDRARFRDGLAEAGIGSR